MKSLIKYWRSLTPLTRNIFRFAVINIILINLVLIILFETPKTDTVIYHTKAFLQIRQENNDSWNPMRAAFDYIVSNEQGSLLYDHVFFDNKTKFQYPPSSLLIFYPLRSIDKFLEYLDKSENDFLNGFSWLLVISMTYCVIRIFNFSLTANTDNSTDCCSKIDLLTRNILLFGLMITFYPVVKAFSLGQIQVWINALFAMLFWSWLRGKKAASGIILGIMCLVKPQYSIIILWGFLRKQWIFLLASVITALVGVLASILIFGIENNINYLDVLSFISKHGEIYYPNQSVNGLVNRLLFNGDNLNFDQNSFPAFNRYVYIATLTSSVFLISTALFQPQKINEKGSIFDLSIVTITCTIASPVAWEHHYGILLPIYAFLTPYLLREKIIGKWTIPLFCISYILTSNYFAIVNKLAYSKFSLNIFQSYLFVGSLILLVLLYATKRYRSNISTQTKKL